MNCLPCVRQRNQARFRPEITGYTQLRRPERTEWPVRRKSLLAVGRDGHSPGAV